MFITIPVRKAGRSINVDMDRLIGEKVDIATFVAQVNSGETPNEHWLAYVLDRSPKLQYVLAYGLTQSLNDAHAADTKKTSATPDTIMAAVEKKLAAIYDGSVRVKGKSAGSGDPVEREAFKIARKWWKSKGVAAQNAAIGKLRGIHEKLVDVEDAAIADLIIAANAKSASTIEKAQAIVAANSLKVEDVEIDIESLMSDEDEESDDETDEDEENNE